MDKNLIEHFVVEVKEQTFLEKLFKKSVIPFDKYFKYSGDIEIEKKLKDFESSKVTIKKIVTDDPIIQFYFNVPGYTLEEIAQVFGIQESVVSNNLDEYFNNLKIKKDGNNFKNENR